MEDNAAFCTNCGVALDGKAKKTNFRPNTSGLQERSLITALVLSVITCGIYSLYWLVKLTDEMNQASERSETSGVTALLLSIVTCGLYSIYWSYKMGEKRDIIANEDSSSGLIYLLLSVFGLGIVVYILAQESLNKAIANN